MKLLTKTTLYFLAAMVPLLAVAGFYLFNKFSKEINSRSDKELISEEYEWIKYLESETANGTSFILKSPDITIFPTDAAATPYATLTNIYGYNAQGEKIPFRQLSQVIAIGNIPYLITIRQSQEQKAALVTDVTRIMFFVFAGLFIATLIFNWAISKQLWAPFRRSLHKIRGAELQKMQAIYFEETSTQEFNELNTALNYMTGRIYRDFVNMKEFTENAAHEMQTPIAGAQSKLELLLQDANLKEEQVQAILQATDALNRLSKLNQSLLLLAKIENNQYETGEAVSFKAVSEKYLSLFDAFIKDKQIIIKTNFEEDFKTALHSLLADSLISNLLGNAIKYNYKGGTIEIKTNTNSFSISNTSMQPSIPKEKLFTRFNSANNSEEPSNGFGLAIVKKIVDTNNLHITYDATNGVHRFTILNVL
ncbi:HAMP domain-containing histidine kinase [Ilyomonas limi]|uniref:histidine kinase n=1 Tax=Ilyomonas limi TaxID=2575867 RepID=A0A4U3L8K4_9BACT|nr:HAMP domain-containing sensor histidine kinase [Ilyomonas limi]TKK70784.1 HAMP domain-containing histidine kinase [Ilyomonas limi]